MKKTFSTCLLATSLFAISQLATAVDSDPAKICPLLTEIQTLPLRQVEYDAYRDVSNVATDYQHKEDSIISYQYIFYVKGVKGADAEDVIKKVKNALSIAATTNPAATRIDRHFYSSTCTYSLDFSTSGDNYNGTYPVATIEINGI